MLNNNINYYIDCVELNLPRTYIDELLLKNNDEIFKAAICICYLPITINYPEAVQYLHPQELKYYKTLKVDKRKKSYLLGRYSAKQAVFALIGEDNPQSILIRQGVFNHPVITYANNQNIQVSITHCEDIGAAVVFPEVLPMGIDFEEIDLDKINVLEGQMTEEEKGLIRTFPYSYDAMLVLLWTAKEALSKVLKTGLMTPFHIFEINNITTKHNHNCLVSYFKNFAQYKGISFNLGRYICTIVHPKSTEIYLNIDHLKNIFNF